MKGRGADSGASGRRESGAAAVTVSVAEDDYEVLILFINWSYMPYHSITASAQRRAFTARPRRPLRRHSSLQLVGDKLSSAYCWTMIWTMINFIEFYRSCFVGVLFNYVQIIVRDAWESRNTCGNLTPKS